MTQKRPPYDKPSQYEKVLCNQSAKRGRESVFPTVMPMSHNSSQYGDIPEGAIVALVSWR